MTGLSESPGAQDTEERHPQSHPAGCACGHHEPTDHFIASLWRATDASLRAEPERWPTTRTDDLPSRYDRPFQRGSANADPQPDANATQRLGANEAVVAETLRAAGCPLTRREVETQTDLTSAQVSRSLHRLRAAGRVAMSGWGGGTGRGNLARWRLCEPEPEPAPILAPEPTPSSNGSAPPVSSPSQPSSTPASE